MKLSFLYCGAVMTALVTSASIQAQDRMFDFLGFRTDVPVLPVTKLAGKKCKVTQTGISQCNIFAGAILGHSRPTDITVTFNNAHLITITGSAMMNTYYAVSEAFITKYGPPTTTEIMSWQNRLGITIDNRVETWSFADGKLELRQHGKVRDIGEFVFLANRNLPDNVKHEPPPVNF